MPYSLRTTPARAAFQKRQQYAYAVGYGLYTHFAGMLEDGALKTEDAHWLLKYHNFEETVKLGRWGRHYAWRGVGGGYDIFTLEDVDGTPLPVQNMPKLNWWVIQRQVLKDVKADGWVL